MVELLRREIVLECSLERAFELFIDHIDLWWPRGHRRSREGVLRFDHRPGGRIIETAPDGTEWVMASVLMFQPPTRLELNWYPGSPSAPTNARISFAGTAAGTEVVIVHEALSEGAKAVWPDRVALFDAGWAAVLSALQSFSGDMDK